ncbi:MAG: hypothetical protein KatS3mg010_0805 [Acidimicrobiia bacterium]|nr:MAG: hypothetical protein KatS3mg010_0805 [Acidimicrobiia bacterium]
MTPISTSRSHRPGTRPVSFVHASRTLRGRALLREQLAQPVAQLELVGGEGEPHRRGSPSTRSATTLRWISFVPA